MAAIVQTPAATPVTTAPLTLQVLGVEEVKATVKPEVAVALTVVAAPTDSVVGLKVIAPIVCGPVTVMLLVTCGAAL